MKDALKQHAVLKDTTKWEGRRKPRRWAQEAPEAAWWTEMLDHKADPLELTHKAELDWDKTIDALVEQYGRKLFLWSSKKAMEEGKSSAQVMDELRTRCATKLKKGDDALLVKNVASKYADVARQTVLRSENSAALAEEMAE